MADEMAAWLAIALMTAITLFTRYAGAVIMTRIGTTERVTRFLDAMSTSVLAAIVATFLARGGLREVVVIAVAVLAILLGRGAITAMLAGMVLAAAWTHVTG